MRASDVAVFICSSDSRRDVLERVLPSLAKFWRDCPYPIYVGINSPAGALPGVVPVIAPASQWHSETLIQLREIAAEFLIVILDDFLIGAPVNQPRMRDLVSVAVSRRLPYLRLLPLGRSLWDRLGFGAARGASDDILAVRDDHPFFSALQIAIWRKDHLVAMLHKGRSIWEFEQERIDDSGHYAIATDPPIQYRHVVEKGRWLPHAASLFQRAGLVFRAGERACWSRWRYLHLLRERVSWLILGHSNC